MFCENWPLCIKFIYEYTPACWKAWHTCVENIKILLIWFYFKTTLVIRLEVTKASTTELKFKLIGFDEVFKYDNGKRNTTQILIVLFSAIIFAFKLSNLMLSLVLNTKFTGFGPLLIKCNIVRPFNVQEHFAHKNVKNSSLSSKNLFLHLSI